MTKLPVLPDVALVEEFVREYLADGAISGALAGIDAAYGGPGRDPAEAVRKLARERTEAELRAMLRKLRDAKSNPGDLK